MCVAWRHPLFPPTPPMSTGITGRTFPIRLVPSSRYLPMNALSHALADFLWDESGPTAVEYAVMLALIIVVCITAITTLGTNANNTFSYIGQRVGSAGS